MPQITIRNHTFCFCVFLLFGNKIVILWLDNLAWCIRTSQANAFKASAHAEPFCGFTPASKEARVGKEARHN